MTPEEIKFNNYSLASKLRMSNTPKSDRVARARKGANTLHASRTPEERRAIAMKMVRARQEKWLKL